MLIQRNVSVILWHDYEMACALDEVLNDTFANACPQDKDLNLMRYLLQILNATVKSVTTDLDYAEDGDNEALYAVSVTSETEYFDTYQPTLPFSLDQYYAIIRRPSEAKETEEDAVFQPFQAELWAIVALVLFVVLLVDFRLSNSSISSKAGKHFFACMGIYLSCFAGHVGLFYGSNLRAMTSMSRCPQIPFDSLPSLTTAIREGQYKLVTYEKMLNYISTTGDTDLIQLHAALQLNPPLLIDYISQACSSLMESNDTVKFVFIELLSVFQGPCQDVLGNVYPIPLKEFPAGVISFLTTKNSSKLAEDISLVTTLMTGYYKRIYLNGPAEVSQAPYSACTYLTEHNLIRLGNLRHAFWFPFLGYIISSVTGLTELLVVRLQSHS